MTLRTRLNDALKSAMKAKDQRAVSTVRLILAALKDRDIAARSKGKSEGIDDTEILQMLQTMVKQREDSIALYEKGGRLELAQQEQEEIDIIRSYLPKQLSDAEIADAINQVVDELGATSLKDMGRTMAVLRERYAGQMDFAKASSALKSRLS